MYLEGKANSIIWKKWRENKVESLEDSTISENLRI